MKKRGIVINTLVWWIIGIAVLAIVLVLAVILKDKLFEIGDFLKNIFR